MPAQNIAMQAAPPLDPVRDWAGVWSDGTNTLHISPAKAGARLRMSSELVWEGGVSPGGERRANFGGMDAALDVQGSKATASDGDCSVALTRIGKYLVADDNGSCGGMNVRHTGVYFRRPH